MILLILSFLCGLATGFLVLRNNKDKAASLEAKGKSLLDSLKGK